MLTHTIADIPSRVVTETSAGGLEVNSLLDTGQVGPSQIRRSTNELNDGARDGLEDLLGKRAGRDRWVADLVDGKLLLPALRELTSNAAGELGVFLGVLLPVRSEELVPRGLEGSTALADLGVRRLGRIGDNKVSLGVESELGLDVSSVVGLESCWSRSKKYEKSEMSELLTGTVNTVSALELGSVANGSAELDERGLGLGLLGGGNRIVDGSKVTKQASN